MLLPFQYCQCGYTLSQSQYRKKKMETQIVANFYKITKYSSFSEKARFTHNFVDHKQFLTWPHQTEDSFEKCIIILFSSACLVAIDFSFELLLLVFERKFIRYKMYCCRKEKHVDRLFIFLYELHIFLFL